MLTQWCGQYTFRQEFVSRVYVGAKTLNATLILNVQWFRQPDYIPAQAIYTNLMGFFSGWADMVRLRMALCCFDLLPVIDVLL
jgi:hypothetical protein